MKSLSFKTEENRRDEIIMKCVYHPVVMVLDIHLKICKCTSSLPSSLSLSLLEENTRGLNWILVECGRMWMYTQSRGDKSEWKTSEFKCQKQIDIELEWLSTLLDTLYAKAIEAIFPKNTHTLQSLLFFAPLRSLPFNLWSSRSLLFSITSIHFLVLCVLSKQVDEIERLNYFIL